MLRKNAGTSHKKNLVPGLSEPGRARSPRLAQRLGQETLHGLDLALLTLLNVSS
jgi:hypothetical protein